MPVVALPLRGEVMWRLGGPEGLKRRRYRRNSGGAAIWADENVGGDAQLLAQMDDHGDGRGPVVSDRRFHDR